MTLLVVCLMNKVSAAALNPANYPVLGSLTATQDVIIDTTQLKVLVGGVPVAGWNGQVISQSGGATNLAVFCFSQFTISSTNTLTIQGALPAAVLSRGNIVFGSNVIVTAGGGLGGARSYSGDPASYGSGPGGGEGGYAGPGNSSFGNGGGGSFGGRGSPGYGSDYTAAPGEPYGDLAVALEAGSGGGGGCNEGPVTKNCTDGGKGGGAVEFVATGTLSLPASASIRANGERYPPPEPPDVYPAYGGGGSGGGIILKGGRVNTAGAVEVSGAYGGDEVFDAAGGGGGRVSTEIASFYYGQDHLGMVDSTGYNFYGDANGVTDLLVKEVVVPGGQSLVLTSGSLPAETFPSTYQQQTFGKTFRASGGTLIVDGNMPDAAGLTAESDGAIRIASGSTTATKILVKGDGNFEVGSGTSLTCSGKTSIEAGGALTVLGGFSSYGVLLNGGCVNVIGTTVSATNSVANTTGAEINAINATLNFSGSGTYALVNFNKLNLVDVKVYGSVNSPAGSEIQVAGAVTFYGLVHGAANFPGSGLVTFKAGYEPGDSPAQVLFNGDVTFSGGGSLVMELGGTTAGSEYDRLVSRGTLRLDGLLEIRLYGGFTPKTGDRFDLFDGAFTGGFSSISLPDLGEGLVWDTSSLYITGELAVKSVDSGTVIKVSSIK